MVSLTRRKYTFPFSIRAQINILTMRLFTGSLLYNVQIVTSAIIAFTFIGFVNGKPMQHYGVRTTRSLHDKPRVSYSIPIIDPVLAAESGEGWERRRGRDSSIQLNEAISEAIKVALNEAASINSDPNYPSSSYTQGVDQCSTSGRGSDGVSCSNVDSTNSYSGESSSSGSTDAVPGGYSTKDNDKDEGYENGAGLNTSEDNKYAVPKNYYAEGHSSAGNYGSYNYGPIPMSYNTHNRPHYPMYYHSYHRPQNVYHHYQPRPMHYPGGYHHKPSRKGHNYSSHRKPHLQQYQYHKKNSYHGHKNNYPRSYIYKAKKHY